MKRLTTDNPKDNIENALNLFYGKDGWTWVRGGGPAPDYADISLCDFVRMLVKANIPNAELPKDDDALSDLMCDWLIDEPDSAEGIISLLYTAGWAFAELRHRLAGYEDLEAQGRLVVLPCVAQTDIERDGHIYRGDHWSHILTAFREDPTSPSGMRVALIDIEEAERALEGQR